jgi:hypothetical protein
MLESWKLAPSLAAGCPVVLKPAEWTPLSASLLPEIMAEARVHDQRRRDYWGNAVIPSWYAEATTVLDLDGVPQPVTDSPDSRSEVRVGADGLGSIDASTNI